MPGSRVFSFVSIPRIEVVEVILAAGFDGVLIDLEHGAIGVSELPALIAAADAGGGDCFVRVDSVDSEVLGTALDSGASGVVVPHVEDAESAARVVSAARFDRSRGFNPFVRAGGYGTHSDFTSTADAAVEIVPMIEGSGGVASASEIVHTDGVTGVFLGPYDLSLALGRPGETRHPEVVEAIGGVIQIAVAAGRSAGVFCSTAADAARWRERGADMLFIGVDAAVLLGGYRQILDELAQHVSN